jgi:hypothetical protein
MFIDNDDEPDTALPRSAMFHSMVVRPVHVSLRWSEDLFVGSRVLQTSRPYRGEEQQRSVALLS